MSFRTCLMLTTALFTPILAAGCADETLDNPDLATAQSASSRGADADDTDAPAPPDLEALSDGQLLFVADTANAGEVEQARAAFPKLEDERVRAFAEEMLVGHQAARDELLRFSDENDVFAKNSRVAVRLKREGQRVVDQLLRADVPADEPYVDTQVLAHTEALALYDQLVAAADSPELRDLFDAQRATVAEHHDEVTDLDQELDTDDGHTDSEDGDRHGDRDRGDDTGQDGDHDRGDDTGQDGDRDRGDDTGDGRAHADD